MSGVGHAVQHVLHVAHQLCRFQGSEHPQLCQPGSTLVMPSGKVALLIGDPLLVLVPGQPNGGRGQGQTSPRAPGLHQARAPCQTLPLTLPLLPPKPLPQPTPPHSPTGSAPTGETEDGMNGIITFCACTQHTRPSSEVCWEICLTPLRRPSTYHKHQCCGGVLPQQLPMPVSKKWQVRHLPPHSKNIFFLFVTVLSLWGTPVGPPLFNTWP